MNFSDAYVRLKPYAVSLGKAIGQVNDWLRGKKRKPKTTKVKVYALTEKGTMKHPGDIFILPGTKSTQARVLGKEYKLICHGRSSHDVIIITYSAVGVKSKTIVLDANTEVKVLAKQPPKAKMMPVYNWLQQLSKKLEIKEEF